jgi:hypothetical protein
MSSYSRTGEVRRQAADVPCNRRPFATPREFGWCKSGTSESKSQIGRARLCLEGMPGESVCSTRTAADSCAHPGLADSLNLINVTPRSCRSPCSERSVYAVHFADVELTSHRYLVDARIANAGNGLRPVPDHHSGRVIAVTPPLGRAGASGACTSTAEAGRCSVGLGTGRRDDIPIRDRDSEVGVERRPPRSSRFVRVVAISSVRWRRPNPRESTTSLAAPRVP